MGTLYINNDELWTKLDSIKPIKPIPTNIKAWDTFFDGIRQGSLYMICALRGTGKTSFLLAMAKQMNNLGYRTLYVSIEQNIEQLKDYIPRKPNFDVFVMEALKDWDEIEKVIKNYDFIFYDYIGALSERNNDPEWQSLRYDSNKLGHLAKNYNVGIITACQGNDELATQMPKSLPYNAKYVNYGKGIIDSVAGAIYLVRYSGQLYIKEFKNRYGEFHYDAMPIKLDLKKKEFMAF